MAKTNTSGYEIYYDETEEQWKYSDNHESIHDNPRSCVRCSNKPNELGHDYCLQNLGFVTNACCGHGVENGYIQFDDGTIIEGDFKVIRQPKYNQLIETEEDKT